MVGIKLGRKTLTINANFVFTTVNHAYSRIEEFAPHKLDWHCVLERSPPTHDLPLCTLGLIAVPTVTQEQKRCNEKVVRRGEEEGGRNTGVLGAGMLASGPLLS